MHLFEVIDGRPGPDDRAIVDAVLAGDVDAYRLLVERESRTVVGLCAAILGNLDDAQDVAQEAFVQAFRSLAGYRADGSFGAWVGRIARRMAVQRAAALSRARLAVADVADFDKPDDGAGPELQLLSGEQASSLRRAVASLPSDQREVIQLRYFGDRSLDSIASETGAPLGTVKSRLHRGLARLRNHSDLRSAS